MADEDFSPDTGFLIAEEDNRIYEAGPSGAAGSGAASSRGAASSSQAWLGRGSAAADAFQGGGARGREQQAVKERMWRPSGRGLSDRPNTCFLRVVPRVRLKLERVICIHDSKY